MQNFKQYLQEKQDNFAPWHITDPEKILDMLNNGSEKTGCKINKNGSVTVLKDRFSPTSVLQDIETADGKKRVLMVKFSTAKYFEVISPSLYSLWGLPDKCSVGLAVFCSSLKTLEHLTPIIKGNLYISCSSLEEVNSGNVQCAIVNFFNIGKLDICKDWKQFGDIKCKSIGLGTTVANAIYKKPVLNLCKLLSKTGASTIKIFDTHTGTISSSSELDDVMRIVSKNYNDILACQDELIENGFKEYAKF